MTRTLSIILLLLAALSPALAQPANNKAEAEVRATLDAAHAALARSDKKFYEQYLAEGYVEADQDGKTWSRADILQNWLTPQNSKTTITAADLKLQIHGDFALASYRFDWRYEMKDQTFNNSFRVSDVLQRQGGRWRLLAEHYSLIPKPPVLAKVNPKLYDDYAGQYQAADGITGIITREGDKLFEQMAGTPLKQELLPESETTFRTKEQRWQRVFVRDTQGRVTHLLVRTPDGQEFKANKIK